MNTNYAIPGLLTPASPNQESRGVTVPVGSLLLLGEWPDDMPLPDLLVRPATRHDHWWGVVPRNRISESRGNQRLLSVWLPEDLPAADWVLELTDVAGVVRRRVLFCVGAAEYSDVPICGVRIVYPLTDNTTAEIMVDTLWCGTLWTRDLVVTDESGAALDMAGWSAAAQLRTQPGGFLLTTMDVDILDTVGTLRVTLAGNLSIALPEGDAWWDVLLTDPEGNYVRIEPQCLRIRVGVTDD